MYSTETVNRLHANAVGPRSGSTKLKFAILRGAVTLAVLSALLIVARPAQSQTESVLYNFTSIPDGANPYGGITFNGGNIYGTTYNGGANGFGSVYQLSPNGSGGWNETVLYSFCPAGGGCVDGQNPPFSTLLFDSKGNIYGTTFSGGANGNGVVFQLTPSGNTWTEKVAYSFGAVPDAQNPVNGLIMDKSGNIFGTAYNGGGGGNGAVFELSPNGSGGWTEQVVYPVNSLFGGIVMNSAGAIFGTTATSVFELQSNGSGGWFLTTPWAFNPSAAATQGSNPNGTVTLDAAGNIYGTTTAGGKNNLGVVYKLTLGTNGKYTERLLYSFGANGTAPFAGVVLDSAGNIYGTTRTGGKNGAGIVYELALNSNGTYAEKSLQPFIGENGAAPYAGLVLDSKGYLYGTTFYGGSSGFGTVFVANAHAATTALTVTSSLNPSKSGQAVTFTATITSAVGPPPDGSIIVFEPVGQAPMTNGVATYTTSSLNVGKTKITAVYDGDLNFIKSMSPSIFQLVGK